MLLSVRSSSYSYSRALGDQTLYKAADLVTRWMYLHIWNFQPLAGVTFVSTAFSPISLLKCRSDKFSLISTDHKTLILSCEVNFLHASILLLLQNRIIINAMQSTHAYFPLPSPWYWWMCLDFENVTLAILSLTPPLRHISFHPLCALSLAYQFGPSRNETATV